MPSSQIINTTKSFALISFLTFTGLQNSVAEEGYPAPPGHYAPPGLFKDIPLNDIPLATKEDETTPTDIAKEPVQIEASETIETEKETSTETKPENLVTHDTTDESLAAPNQPIPDQSKAIEVAAPLTSTAVTKTTEDDMPDQPITNKTIPTPETIAPTLTPEQQPQSYPNAFALQKSYQQAKNLPFSQWGNMPKQGYQSNNPNDYGSTAVPINPPGNRNYPTVMNQSSKYPDHQRPLSQVFVEWAQQSSPDSGGYCLDWRSCCG